MTELLEVEPEHSVLEIGTGSGYQTAVLALLARRVYSLERVPELAQQAIPSACAQLGLDNVKIQAFDGTVGWSEVGAVRPHPGHRRRARGAGAAARPARAGRGPGDARGADRRPRSW